MKKATMLLAMIFFVGILVSQTAEPPEIGIGTSTNPYQIANLNNLYWLSQNSSEWDQKHYIQTADINAADTYNWNGGAGFSPIGITDTAFTSCSYDGKGFVIDSLFININSDYDHGFFGKVVSSDFENINLTNVNVTGYSGVGALVGYSDGSDFTNCTSSGSVSGYDRVGGLIGDSYAYSAFNNITDCHSSCDVTGSGGEKIGGLIGAVYHSYVGNCSARGTVNSANNYVGGLIGSSGIMNVSKCFATGNVSGNENVGGLLGYAYSSSIGNSYARGNITGSSNTGGLVGYLNQCGNDSPGMSYSTGFINGAGTYIGGLVGQIYWGTVTNSFFDYETAGTTSNSAGGVRKTTAEMTDVSTFTDSTHTDLSEPWDFVENPNYDTANDDIWDIDSSLNDGYPFLSWQKLEADFTVSSTNLVTCQSVHFSDASNGFPTAWEWDFDNNGTIDSTEKNPTYIFNSAGIYTVTLTITNTDESSTETKIDLITVNTPSITRDLVAYYPFSGNTNDTSGNNHHGTNNGATLTTDRFGETDSAYDFDGTSYITIPRSIQDNFTIAFWMKSSQTAGSETNFWQAPGLIDGEVSGVVNDFGVDYGNGKALFWTGNPDVLISSEPIADDQWHFVTATRNMSNGKLNFYIDNVFTGTNFGGTQSLTSPSQLLVGKNVNNYFFSGLLDDIRLYDRVLSNTEIEMIYTLGNVPPVMEMTLISDSSMDFGTIYYGLDNTRTIIIKNDGNVNLSVSDISFASGNSNIFSYTYDNLNGDIIPSATDTIFVTFTPNEENTFNDTIKITNNSTNNPMISVSLSGSCEYDDLPSPQNVNIVLDNRDATITWNAVTHTVHGISVTPDFYVINYSEDANASSDDYLHLTATENLNIVHNRVVQFSEQMFYQVIAIRDYEGEYSKDIFKKKGKLEKITWEEFKKKMKIKE